MGSPILPVVPGSLVKEQLATSLKAAILQGRLSPGQRVVESAWARHFGVAQASVREAINSLIGEGFLVKDAGRSARVIQYREQDIARIYEVREALEAQAGRLAIITQADLTPVEKALDRMIAAFERSDLQFLIQSDLDFHLAIAEASGNLLLADLVGRQLIPLFAFVRLRVVETGQVHQAWRADLPRHRRILDLLREGDPDVAAAYIRHCVRLFAGAAHQVWANPAPGKRTPRSQG